MTAPTVFRCATASPSTARWCLLVGLGFGTLVLLPGCPLSDNFTIKESSNASGASSGTSSATEAGGTSQAAQVIGTTSKPSTDLAAGGSSSPLQSWSWGGANIVGGNVAASGGATSGSADAAGGAGTASEGATDAGGEAATGGSNADPGTGGLQGASGSRGAGGGAAGRNGAPGISGATSNVGASGASNSVTCPDALAKAPRGCKGPADPQLCYRSCGLASLGTQSLTCVGNEYVESTCTYPIGQNYGCYRIPPTIPATCPAGPPQEGTACSVAPCTVCFGGNPTSPSYLDATNSRKGGYCVCVQPGQWSCASAASWPCPSLINGC